MTIGKIDNHLAPTPLEPREYTLFFVPNFLAPAVEGFFANLAEPDDYFLLISAMRIDQLGWRPARIKRNDVRVLTRQDEGVWVALSKPHQSAQLRKLLDKHHRG